MDTRNGFCGGRGGHRGYDSHQELDSEEFGRRGHHWGGRGGHRGYDSHQELDSEEFGRRGHHWGGRGGHKGQEAVHHSRHFGCGKEQGCDGQRFGVDPGYHHHNHSGHSSGWEGHRGHGHHSGVGPVEFGLRGHHHFGGRGGHGWHDIRQWCDPREFAQRGHRHYGGHHWGHGLHGFGGHESHPQHLAHGLHGWHHRRHPLWTSSSSSSCSSSESENEDKKGIDKKKSNKECKRMYKLRERMSDPKCGHNWDKTKCTLCWHRIKPLVDTEVLNCGHIYHKLCLKELFGLSLKGEQKDVFCIQCKDKIDKKLIQELQNRFTEDSTLPQSSEQQLVNDWEKLKV